MESILVAIILSITVLPVVVYMCVKLGTVAFYRGRAFWEKEKDKFRGDK